jgi:hypothetical protein
MRKSLVLILTAIGGGASYAAGVTEASTGPSLDDPSTWRWQVSSILADQDGKASRSLAVGAALDAEAFNQRHERYSPLGRRETQGDVR